MSYELNHLLKSFAVRDSDNSDRLIALNGSSAKVYLEGATVKTGVTLSAATATNIVCESVGRIEAGNVLQVGVDNTDTMTVNSVDIPTNTVNATSTLGTTLTAGDRLVVVTPAMGLYGDELGATTESNPVTLSNDGLMSVFIPDVEVDIIVTDATLIPSPGKLLFTDVPVPISRRYTGRQFSIWPDGGDMELRIAAACEFISDRGGGVLELEPGTHAIDTGVPVPPNVTICGAGRDITIIEANAGNFDMFTDDNGGDNVGFENLTLKHAASATHKIINFDPSGLADFHARNVKFENGKEQLYLNDATDSRILNCDFLGEAGVTDYGLHHNNPAEGNDISGCSFDAINGITDACIRAVSDSGANGSLSIRGCQFRGSSAGRAISLEGTDATNKLEDISISGVLVNNYANGIVATFTDRLRVDGACSFKSTTTPMSIDTHTRDNGFGGFWYDGANSYPVAHLTTGAPTDTPSVAAIAYDPAGTGTIYVYDTGSSAWRSVATT